MCGLMSPIVAMPNSSGLLNKDHPALKTARMPINTKGAHTMNNKGPTRAGTGSGCDNAQPHSQAATISAGVSGHHNRNHAARSSSNPGFARERVESHAPINCSATPPSRMVNTVNSDSRSIFRSPSRDDDSLQLIEQFRVNGIHGVDEGRDGGMRSRSSAE